jgi:hypothetical protein
MLFLRLRAKPVKEKERRVQLQKRTFDPEDTTSQREDYGYQQLKDCGHGAFLHPAS